LKREAFPEDIQAISRARTVRLLEERMLERLDIFPYMPENEVSALIFPNFDGRFDYLGFSASDERAHKLGRDLFQYYWKKLNHDANSFSNEKKTVNRN
jgi:predicted transcriptional regulator